MILTPVPDGKAVLFGAAADAGAALVIGKIIRALHADGLEIEIGDEAFEARIGFGCIVRPIAGDRVLAVRGRESVFVVAILERLVPDRATLALPLGGALAIEGDAVRLTARGELSLDAQAISARSATFNIVADSLTLLGRMANWVAQHLRISATTQETVADTISSKAIDRVSIIEGTDVLRTQSLTQTVDGVAVMSAPIAVIATSEDLRLDGKRVTVG